MTSLMLQNNTSASSSVFHIPVTFATSDRTFSALKCNLTSVRSSVTESRSNNCLHSHKDLPDSLDWLKNSSTMMNDKFLKKIV